MRAWAAQPGGGLRSWTLAWGVAVGGAWIVGAAWADSWSHVQLGDDDGLLSGVHVALYAGLAIVVCVLQTAAVVTPLLVTLRRFELPLGAAFLVAAWGLALPAIPHGAALLVVAGLMAAVAIELAGAILKPRRSIHRLRSFGALSGAVIGLGYVGAVTIAGTLAWPPEVVDDDQRLQPELRRQ